MDECGAEGTATNCGSGIASDLDQDGSSNKQNTQTEANGRRLAFALIHLGTPPEQFQWQWRDKDNEFHRTDLMTPQDFVADYVDVDWEDYICLVHDPRNAYYQTYTVDHLQNVAGGPPVVYLNIPVQEMKNITQRLLENDTPVWMGCDVGKQMERTRGLWDAQLFETKALYGLQYGLNKADRLRYGQTMMTHAMLFTGVDVVDGSPRRWRVENSWGSEKNGQKGYYTMNDSWYDEYMFEIAAPRNMLSEDMLKGLATEPIVLPAWDPMGSLARQEPLSEESDQHLHHVFMSLNRRFCTFR